MHNVTDRKFVLSKLPKREENSNKSTFGKVLNIAGSINYTGAAFLSSKAALKTGCGYLTLACIEEIMPIIASMAPEITFKPLKSKDGAIALNNTLNLNCYDVVSIGCGITNTKETQNFLINLLNNRNINQSLVLDADGINILGSTKENISLKNAVITPHPKELSRLLNVNVEEILSNREKYAITASQKYDCITLLKGHNSIITDGDKIYTNPTGSSALAKAGSGDVLTGIIAGFLAQKVSAFNSAIISAYLHGLAGDIAAKKLTQYCVLASDIIDYLPFAIISTKHNC